MDQWNKERCTALLEAVASSWYCRKKLGLAHMFDTSSAPPTESLAEVWNALIRMRELLEKFAPVHSKSLRKELKRKADVVQEDIDAALRFVNPLPKKFFRMVTNEDGDRVPDFVDYEGSEINEPDWPEDAWLSTDELDIDEPVSAPFHISFSFPVNSIKWH